MKVVQEKHFIMTSPDSEEWDREWIEGEMKFIAEMLDVSFNPTGYSRDLGHGDETEYILEGTKENVLLFLQKLREL